MEGLTKENFFNLMSDNYPFGMRLFTEWIDEQKKILDWNKIFNSDSEWQDCIGKNAPAPKFHDLPFELQFGMLSMFILKRDKNIKLEFSRGFIMEEVSKMVAKMDAYIKSGGLER